MSDSLRERTFASISRMLVVRKSAYENANNCCGPGLNRHDQAGKEYHLVMSVAIDFSEPSFPVYA